MSKLVACSGLLKAWILVWLAIDLGRLGAADWPGWRGPNHDGVCLETNAPLRWSRTENVRWRTALAEPGNSSPIVWGDTVYITQALKEKRALMAFDRRNGRVRWTSGLDAVGVERTRETNPLCSPTPVTDGERIIAWFGSAGLVAFDSSGRQLWRANLGPHQHQFGYASSPVLHEGRVFLNFGPGIQEFVVAIDKRNGKELWRVSSPAPAKYDAYGTWSTPVLTRVDGEPQLLIALRDYFAGLDPATGKVIWFARGLGPQAKSSPVAGEGIAVISGDLRGVELAIRLGGKGDLTETGLVWRESPPRSRISTGIALGGHLYGARANGILDCLELETGESVWEERQKGAGANSAIWASPILVGNRLYVVNQGGDTVILRAEPQFRIDAINRLGETCNATPAIAYGDLFLRTWNALWCIQPAPTTTNPPPTAVSATR